MDKYSIMMLMKFAELSQSECLQQVEIPVHNLCGMGIMIWEKQPS